MVPGAQSLWWLYADRPGGPLHPELRAAVIDAYQLRLFPLENSKFGYTFDGRRFEPGFKVVEEEYQEGLAWAKAVETIYRAKSDEERTILVHPTNARVRS